MKYFIKVLGKWLGFVVFFTFQLNAQAKDSDILEEAYQLQLKAYQASTSFHMYTLLEGDRQVADDIAEIALQIGQQVDAWQADDMSSVTEDLIQRSKKFLQLVQANEIAEEGYTSIYTVNDMEDSLESFLAELELLTPIEEEESLQSEILKSAVLIRKIGSRYARLAAHWNARTGILADQEGDTIDVHAEAVTEQLDVIMNRGDLTPAAQDSLGQVVKKWQFISPKLMDYQNDTVPYLVTRYSTSIVNQLLSAL